MVVGSKRLSFSCYASEVLYLQLWHSLLLNNVQLSPKLFPKLSYPNPEIGNKQDLPDMVIKGNCLCHWRYWDYIRYAMGKLKCKHVRLHSQNMLKSEILCSSPLVDILHYNVEYIYPLI